LYHRLLPLPARMWDNRRHPLAWPKARYVMYLVDQNSHCGNIFSCVSCKLWTSEIITFVLWLCD
jgi:hypothetical protein